MLRSTFLTSAVATALALIALSAPASARQDQPLAKRADAAWAAHDWEHAASLYQDLVKERPDSAVAWHRLGYALHSLHRMEDALAAHQKAAELSKSAEGEVHALSLYNVACASAVLGKRDAALEALAGAIAAGMKDGAMIAQDEDLASLRSDPRFEKLVASAASGKKKVAIVVHEGVEMLDFAGPAEVFASVHLRPAGMMYEVWLVAPSKGEVHTQHIGGSIQALHSIDDCPQPDIVLVPGGQTNRLLDDPRFMAWFAGAAEHAQHVVSVCTGAFVLAKAGVLDGKEATTHHSAWKELATGYPKVKVVEGVRFVDNGRVVTAGGVSAGIDAALRIVEQDFGKDAAADVARYIEHSWPPPTEEVRVVPQPPATESAQR